MATTPLTSTPPSSFQERFKDAYGTFQKGVTYAEGLYDSAQEFVITAANKVLPESVRPIAAKVVRAVPETIFCACMFTGTYHVPALGIWAAKSISLIAPFVKAAINDGFGKVSMTAAFNESKTRFATITESFKPALVAIGAAGCVLSTVVAVARLSARMFMTATLFGILGAMAYKAMESETPNPVGGGSALDSTAKPATGDVEAANPTGSTEMQNNK